MGTKKGRVGENEVESRGGKGRRRGREEYEEEKRGA